MGCGLVIDGEETMLTGDLQPANGKTVHDLIEESGAPKLLLDTYPGRLEEHGLGNLRLVDNGAIAPKGSLPDLEGPPHVYHLIPRQASKADAVARHMRARGYSPDECIAVGDSREDLGVAAVVGRFFLVANAVEKDPDVLRGASANVEVAEGRNGEGFYEAVVKVLAER